MYNLMDAKYASEVLNINFNKFSIEDFLNGINIELEHGLINPNTNVTNNDLILSAKIALAHLNEYPNYYNKDYEITKYDEFLKNKMT